MKTFVLFSLLLLLPMVLSADFNSAARKVPGDSKRISCITSRYMYTSPRGSYFVYIDSMGNCQLYDANAGCKLHQSFSCDREFYWSPDERHFLYTVEGVSESLNYVLRDSTSSDFCPIKAKKSYDTVKWLSNKLFALGSLRTGHSDGKFDVLEIDECQAQSEDMINVNMKKGSGLYPCSESGVQIVVSTHTYGDVIVDTKNLSPDGDYFFQIFDDGLVRVMRSSHEETVLEIESPEQERDNDIWQCYHATWRRGGDCFEVTYCLQGGAMQDKFVTHIFRMSESSMHTLVQTLPGNKNCYWEPISWSPSERYYIYYDDAGTRLCDVETLEIYHLSNSCYYTACFSENGKHLYYTTDEGLFLYQLPDQDDMNSDYDEIE